MLNTGSVSAPTIAPGITLYGPTGTKSALVTGILVAVSGVPVTIALYAKPAGGASWLMFEQRVIANGGVLNLVDIFSLGYSGANSDLLTIDFGGFASGTATIAYTVMGIERD